MGAVKNLGSWSDETMSMVTRINNIFQESILLPKLRKHFITGRIDYCNSLLFKIPVIHVILQCVQNCVALVVSYIPRLDHITPILYQLHWLPV